MIFISVDTTQNVSTSFNNSCLEIINSSREAITCHTQTSLVRMVENGWVVKI